MNGWLQALITLGLGVMATALTIWSWRWKADQASHRLAYWYHRWRRQEIWPYTNGAAIMPIIGAAFLLIGIGTIIGELNPAVVAELTWLGAILGLPLVVLGFWALIRPASWMHPPWLREARRRERAGLPSNVPTPSRLRVPPHDPRRRSN